MYGQTNYNFVPNLKMQSRCQRNTTVIEKRKQAGLVVIGGKSDDLSVVVCDTRLKNK